MSSGWVMFHLPLKSVGLPKMTNSLRDRSTSLTQRMPLNHTNSMEPVSSENVAVSRCERFCPTSRTSRIVPRKRMKPPSFTMSLTWYTCDLSMCRYGK